MSRIQKWIFRKKYIKKLINLCAICIKRRKKVFFSHTITKKLKGIQIYANQLIKILLIKKQGKANSIYLGNESKIVILCTQQL